MRYFFEVSYKGTSYAGFQVQRNANTIQGEVEKALRLFFKKDISLTGSSRTDAGVHALQNYFHADLDIKVEAECIYNLNAMLPADIVLKSIKPVSDNAHCRFDATSREYNYHIYSAKDPFIEDKAYFFPYPLNYNAIQYCAEVVLSKTDFTAFSKKNTQVFTNFCRVEESEWMQLDGQLIYRVKANRFLRGMVRALVATMLKTGRGKMTIQQFDSIFTNSFNNLVDFASPAHGLFLTAVNYPGNVIEA